MPIYALVIMMIFILLDKYLAKLNDIMAMIIIPLLAAAVLIKEYAFDDCRNIYPLRFDFYIPSINTCIEYDGEQHYRPVEYFGGEEAFKQRIINDNIKTQYCKDNNIRLVRISSKSKDEIEEILLNIIQNPVTTTVA